MARSNEFYGRQLFPFTPYGVAAGTPALRGHYFALPAFQRSPRRGHP